ncbi:MAG TPA: TetR/AcrR family transcriptional regulator [Acidimicrobiales bacterium]|nr:TetR/AcrR family transcriptional regulator [Acidimicrobiales bacterium]
MAKTPTAKRPYDARRRRERAEEERRATKKRVVEAARDLFLTKSYVATTMAEIARVAGVALQSVYSAGQSKADLLHLVADLAVAGDDQEVMLLERPSYAAVAAEANPERQVQMIATLIASTMERLAPVWVAYREAAAVDGKAAANLVAAHRRRHETFAGMIGTLPRDRLRSSVEEATDTAWAIGSIDVFLLLRSIQGWDAAQYAKWVSQTLVNQLLVPVG